ncbi:MAG: sensor histidine kinase N-terminal domain-containing protein [Rudaea sp.]
MTVTVLRPKSFSLRARLTLMLASAVLLALGGATRLVDWGADGAMQQRFDASLLARAESLASLVRIENGKVAVDAENPAIAVFPGNAEASWYELRCRGVVIAHTAELPPALSAGPRPRFGDANLADGRMLRVVTFPFDAAAEDSRAVPPVHCELRYALNRGPLDDILSTLDFILVGSLLGACALVLLLTPWLVRRGLRPVAVLDRAMAGIGPDTPGGRLPDSDTTELVPLVARFNEVLARMDAGLARERQFASGLAHEFRTRLAELRMLVDVEMRYPSGRDVNNLFGEVGNIGIELEAIVTALLQLTRIESGLEQPHYKDVTLESLLGRVCGRQQETARKRAVAIELGASADAAQTLATDPVLMEIVLDNLLGNAVAYAPSGTTVSVQTRCDRVTIRNSAPALHQDDLANMSQRFWRKGEQGSGHAGLGLALAGAAARALQMELEFRLAAGILYATLRWCAAQVSDATDVR